MNYTYKRQRLYDSVNADHESLTFDLQKVQSLPQLTSNEVYYCRQLSVYNLGIHSLFNGQGIMHVSGTVLQV